MKEFKEEVFDMNRPGFVFYRKCKLIQMFSAFKTNLNIMFILLKGHQ